MAGSHCTVFPSSLSYARSAIRFVRQLSKKTQDALSETTKLAEERLAGIRTVRANGQEHNEAQRYGVRVNDIYELAKKEAVAAGGFFSGVLTLVLLF